MHKTQIKKEKQDNGQIHRRNIYMVKLHINILDLLNQQSNINRISFFFPII